LVFIIRILPSYFATAFVITIHLIQHFRYLLNMKFM